MGFKPLLVATCDYELEIKLKIHRFSSPSSETDEERRENELCWKLEAHCSLLNPNYLSSLLHRNPNLTQITHQPQQSPPEKVSESSSTVPRRWHIQDPSGRFCSFRFSEIRSCPIEIAWLYLMDTGGGYALRNGEYHSMQRCVGCWIRSMFWSQYHSIPSEDDWSWETRFDRFYW